MAEGLNRVLLLGNLGADPELRVTPGGQAVLKIRLATTESYLDRSNTRQERTEWHRITVWGKRGEALAKFLAKGDRIFVEGRIQTSSYEKNGEKRYSTDIIANNIILAGGGRRERGADTGGGGEPRSYGGGSRGGPSTQREDATGFGPASGGPGDEAPAGDFDAGGGGGGGGDDEIPF